MLLTRKKVVQSGGLIYAPLTTWTSVLCTVFSYAPGGRATTGKTPVETYVVRDSHPNNGCAALRMCKPPSYTGCKNRNQSLNFKVISDNNCFPVYSKRTKCFLL